MYLTQAKDEPIELISFLSYSTSSLSILLITVLNSYSGKANREDAKEKKSTRPRIANAFTPYASSDLNFFLICISRAF